MLIALLLTVVGGGVSCLFGLPQLAIKHVRVEGTETVDSAMLTATVEEYLGRPYYFVFRQSNRFLFDSDDLTKQLFSRFVFDSVYVKRSGDTITVQVHERYAQLIWKSGMDRYLVDQRGWIIRPLTEDEKTELAAPDALSVKPILANLRRLPLFVDVNAEPILNTPGTPAVLTAEEIAGADRFFQTLLDQALPFTETKVDRLAGKWMAVKTLAGYDILFDPTEDAHEQAIKLQTVLRESVKDPRGLTYIDLRFGNHVYYK